jgi:hypothetical protein
MSDLHPHSRDDLIELPSDCEPQHVCGCSPALCPTCNPRRSLIAAVRDISAVRDMPIWTFELIRPAPDNLVSLAQERAIRARKRA